MAPSLVLAAAAGGKLRAAHRGQCRVVPHLARCAALRVASVRAGPKLMRLNGLPQLRTLCVVCTESEDLDRPLKFLGGPQLSVRRVRVLMNGKRDLSDALRGMACRFRRVASLELAGRWTPRPKPFLETVARIPDLEVLYLEEEHMAALVKEKGVSWDLSTASSSSSPSRRLVLHVTGGNRWRKAFATRAGNAAARLLVCPPRCEEWHFDFGEDDQDQMD